MRSMIHVNWNMKSPVAAGSNCAGDYGAPDRYRMEWGCSDTSLDENWNDDDSIDAVDGCR